MVCRILSEKPIEKRRKIFPITLTDYATLEKMGVLGLGHGRRFGGRSPQHHIPDFSNWKNHAAFERAFARLEKKICTPASAKADRKSSGWLADAKG
jgi:hypothetical protein